MKVLIVDDNLMNLKLLAAILQAEGYDIVSARDGIDALAKVESENVDAIISDILMPRMDGYRLCYEIRTSERFRRLPFIVYTATYTSDTDEQVSLDLGADRFLRKPAPSEEILQALREVTSDPGERVVRDVDPAMGVDLMKEYSERLVAKLEEKNIELARKVEELSRSETLLREREKSYRILFDCAPDGIVVANEGGYYIDANEAICGMLGYTREEMLKMQASDLVVPEDIPHIQKAFDIVAGIGDHHREWQLRRKDGSIFTADVVGTQMPDGSAMGIIRDVSERKRIEAELLKEQERLAGVIGSAMDAIVTIDEEQNIVLFNSAAEKMFGVSATDAIGHPLDRFIPERFRAGHRVHVENFGRTNVTRRSMRSFNGLFGLRANGEEFPIEASISQIETNGKKTFTAILRDITERHQANQKLLRSEERYRDLVENAHDIIYSHDLEGNYTSINRAGEQITGYTRDEATSLNLVDVVAPEYQEKARSMIAAKLRGEETTSYELEIVAKEGKRVALEVNSRLIHHDGVPVAVQGVARDISARKQLEEQLRQSQKMEAIGQLAGGIAHDFNNLLTVILGYSELLIQRLPLDDPRRRSADAIHLAGERAASLTNQLLAFSRKAVVQPIPVALNEAVRDTEKMLRRLIGENIDLMLTLDESIGQILADPGQLGQVFVNLAVNGRDAMPAGGKLLVETFSAEIGPDYVAQHPYAKEGNYVVMAVSDTGQGIPSDVMSRIFEPFFTTKALGKGTGLGLATVYGIVKQAGGHMEVYSELGKGTSFKVYFPEIKAPVRRGVSGEQPNISCYGNETILVVEDEEMVRDLAVRTLRDFGYNALSARDPAEAQEIAAKYPNIDLLFTDVVMPGASGPELAAILTAEHPGLKVLISSGYTDDSVVRLGMLEAGMSFLQKPYSAHGLGRKVRDVLDQTD